MIRIQVENFRGCSKADLEINGITLIVGDNAVGKSSIAEAAAYAITGKAFDTGRPKTEAHNMVKTGGAERARIVVSKGDESCTLTYPDCKHVPTQNHPFATPAAAGLISLVEMNVAERSATLHEYLKSLPTMKELSVELAKYEIKGEQGKAVAEYIDKYGWDKAHDYYKTLGAQHKRSWHDVTGQTWGSDLAPKWFPRNWENDLVGMSEESLQSDLSRERELLESSLKFEAITDEELSTLQETALGLDKALETWKVTEQAFIDAEAAYKFVTSELKALPRPGVPENSIRIECEKHPGEFHDIVILGSHSLRYARSVVNDESEADAMTAAIKAKQEESEPLAAELQAAIQAHEESKFEVKKAKAAQARWDEVSDHANAPQKKAMPKDQVEKQRKAVERADQRLKAWQLKTSADRHHANVEQTLYIVDVLKPDGLRLTKQSASLNEFNKDYLEKLSEIAGWKTVAIEPDMRITYGGRSYRYISTSEKLRTRVTLQIALAWQEECDLVIIDEADTFDPAGKNGLFSILLEHGVDALVAMKVDRESDIPDLAEPDLAYGSTYQVKDGVAKLFSRMVLA